MWWRCVNTGIDVKNNVATCNCKFNDVTDNDLIHENAALEYFVGELFDLLHSSNILVLKCYDIFKHFLRSYGGMIILILFILCLICSLIFFFIELIKMKRYIFSLTEKYISFLTNYPSLSNFFPPKRNDKKTKTEKILNFLDKAAGEEKRKNLW